MVVVVLKILLHFSLIQFWEYAHSNDSLICFKSTQTITHFKKHVKKVFQIKFVLLYLKVACFSKDF